MSGFKQDRNQLNPTFYRVVLNLAGGIANWTSVAPEDGAVYPQDHSAFLIKPSTNASALRVARGHQRFLAIIEEVSKFADAQILDVEFTSVGVTVADNQPTQVRFTVKYDRDANVLLALENLTLTATATGVVIIDNVANAIRYLVGRAIGRDGYTKRVRVWQPTVVGEFDTTVAVDTPDALANIYADISVVAIDGTSI